MQDIFLRERIQNLTGLTMYSQIEESPVELSVSEKWENILSISDSEYMVFSAYQISLDSDGGDLAGPQLRILAGPTGVALDDASKVFPHADYGEVLNGVTQHLKFGIKVPPHMDVKIQVRGTFTSGVPTAILDFLSVIYNPPLNQ